MKSFNEIQVKPFIHKAIADLNFKKPTEIQEKAVAPILKGESVVGQSQTGSGKTHAYLIPLFDKMDCTQQIPQVVITAPTRELAEQIYAAAKQIASHDEQEWDVRLLVGGTDRGRALERLKQQPQMVIGTPGRIHDFVTSGALHIHLTKALVIDEADTMLDMGFIKEVDGIAGRMPDDLQMLVFSATIPEKLKPFLKKYMQNPTIIETQSKQISADTLENILVPIKSRNKTDLLKNIMEHTNPFLAIIFVNTKKRAEELAEALAHRGITVGRIHGDLAPRERKKMMKQILDLQFHYIVASDIAARGIDIPGVSHVINYEIPTDTDFYIHRVGRAGRAGLEGTAISLYAPEDEEVVQSLEKRNITFKRMDIKNGEWVELADRNQRRKRERKETDVEKVVKKIVKKSNKVKPGYKKKLERERQSLKTKMQRTAKKGQGRGKK